MKYRVQKIADNMYVGEVDFPGDLSRFSVRAVGGDASTAALRAAALSQALIANPLLAQLIPPQAKLAVDTLRAGAQAAKFGMNKLRGLFGKKKKQAARRVARHLKTCHCRPGVMR